MTTTQLSWRAAAWWRVGFSNGMSGEELANPEQLDPKYEDAYKRGLAAGKEKRCQV